MARPEIEIFKQKPFTFVLSVYIHISQNVFQHKVHPFFLNDLLFPRALKLSSVTLMFAHSIKAVLGWHFKMWALMLSPSCVRFRVNIPKPHVPCL